MSRLLTTEQEHHKKAFEQFYALGDRRSYSQLSREIGIPSTTVKLWGRSFNWQGRIRARDADVARRIADKTISSQVDAKGKRRKIIELAVMKLAKAIAEDRVKYQAGDLERLLRLEMLLDEWESGRNVDHTSTPEEVFGFLNSLGAQTICRARQLAWDELLRMFPEYVKAGLPATPPPVPDRIMGQPWLALDAALILRGL